MKNMTLTQIAAACNGKLFLNGCDDIKNAAGVVVDSRKVEEDYLFIATVGEKVDGHNYIDQAFLQGALAVVCEKVPVDPKGPYIVVENSFTALKDIAKWYRMQLNIKVVGITGSVGKTSTKEFISSVLSTKYKVLKTEGNFNNEIGLPLTILKIQDYHEVAVLEMGISEFGEMHRLSEIAKPDICVLTNIGQCHLENLGSREGILKAKSEIFDFMSDDGYICINGDDDMLSTITEMKGRKPIRFGMQADNDIHAVNVVSKGLLGSTCDIQGNNLNLYAKIPLPGEHMILNAMAATAVGTLLHLTTKEIASGIAEVKPMGGRSNIIQNNNWTIIDDCYNANPISMKAAIDLLNLADTNKVAVMGDMAELGDTEIELHRQIGIYAVLKNIDVIVCVGKLSYYMYEAADQIKKEKNINSSLLYYPSREELLQTLPLILKENDTILVKASHCMGFEDVVKTLL